MEFPLCSHEKLTNFCSLRTVCEPFPDSAAHVCSPIHTYTHLVPICVLGFTNVLHNCRPCQFIFANVWEVNTLHFSKIPPQLVTSIPWPLFWPLSQWKNIYPPKISSMNQKQSHGLRSRLYRGYVRTSNFSVNINCVTPAIWGLVLLCNSVILALNLPFWQFLMFVCMGLKPRVSNVNSPVCDNNVWVINE